MKFHWQVKNQKQKVAVTCCAFFLAYFLCSVLGFTKGLISAYAATSAQSIVTQVVLPNKLGLTVPLFITFSPIESGINGTQISTALLNNIQMTDTRSNTDVGWSVNILCSDFVAINQPVLNKGYNNTVTSGGEYTDSQEGIYTIIITTPGDTGTAKFAVTGLETSSGVTGTNIPIGTRGVTVSFAPAQYTTGDSWTIRIDTIPVSNLTITPQDLTSLSGVRGNARLGTTHTFVNNSDPATLITVPGGQTYDSFADSLLFSLNIPPFTFANTYRAQLTITSD